MDRPIRMNRWIVGSAAMHAAVLAALLVRHPLWVAPMKLPGTDHGSRVSMVFSPGRPALQVAAVAPKRAAVPPVVESKLTAPKVAAAAPAVSTPGMVNPTAAAGGDARGTGNVTVALATFFPRPLPDLSRLPSGSRGDVIVDVVIDAQGKILSATMEQGLGHGVDETVMATVQTWTFTPATKDGVAVASEQELLFHFERS